MTYEELISLEKDKKLVPELAMLDDEAASKVLDTKPSTLAVWRSTGRYDLPFIKIGRRVRYRLSDLYAFIEKRSMTCTPYKEASL